MACTYAHPAQKLPATQPARCCGYYSHPAALCPCHHPQHGSTPHARCAGLNRGARKTKEREGVCEKAQQNERCVACAEELHTKRDCLCLRQAAGCQGVVRLSRQLPHSPSILAVPSRKSHRLRNESSSVTLQEGGGSTRQAAAATANAQSNMRPCNYACNSTLLSSTPTCRHAALHISTKHTVRKRTSQSGRTIASTMPGRPAPVPTSITDNRCCCCCWSTPLVLL